jgi:hypothetical protein
MGNALKVAATALGVCLLYVVATGQPMSAQQPPATPQQLPPTSPPATPPQPSAQQNAAPSPAPVVTPPPVIMPAGQFNGGDGFSITLQYWMATGNPDLGTGHANTNGYSDNLSFAGKPRPAPGAILTIPIGKQQHHSIHVSYFRIQGVGNPTATQSLIIFGTGYLPGDYLATHYTLQNARISLDYLSWPFPIKDSKFHVKTLWEVNYTTIASSIDAPLRHGTTDASGAAIATSGYGTDWFIYPSFGLGVDYLVTHNFRFEARASGFIFPHRATIWDTEATLNYRFGKFEIQGGAKAFHFKTSPQKVEFVQGTFPGIFVGLRWYPEYNAR